MILSNQIECLKCGDKPYSSNRHDYRECMCGAVAVDGGMDYLRRTGEIANVKEMSIEMDSELAKALIQSLTNARTRGCNELGILCAVARTIRDEGYGINAL